MEIAKLLSSAATQILQRQAPLLGRPHTNQWTTRQALGLVSTCNIGYYQWQIPVQLSLSAIQLQF